MKAVIHCDMVGGNYAITKSVLHVTHTPASLPSCVNAVADVFAEYAIAGALKAASGAGFEDALVSPEGSKDSFVADITPFRWARTTTFTRKARFESRRSICATGRMFLYIPTTTRRLTSIRRR